MGYVFGSGRERRVLQILLFLLFPLFCQVEEWRRRSGERREGGSSWRRETPRGVDALLACGEGCLDISILYYDTSNNI
jgi:hypothetical protein